METAITIDRPDRAYFAMIPHIVWSLDLSCYAVALYVDLKRVAGENGYCWKTVRKLAEELKVGTGTVTRARRELALKRRQLGGKSLIEVSEGDGRIQVISVTDIWPENMQCHAAVPNDSPKEAPNPNCAPGAHENPNCATGETHRAPGEHECAPGAQKKNNSKKRRTLSRVRESREVVFPISDFFSDYQKTALRCWQEHLEAAGHGFKTLAAWESFLEHYAGPLAAAGTLVRAIEVGMALGNRRLDPDIPVPEAPKKKKERRGPQGEELRALIAVVREQYPDVSPEIPWAEVPEYEQKRATEELARRRAQQENTNHE